MDIKIKKSRKRRYAYLLLLILVVIMAVICLNIAMQFYVINKYLDMRFNFSYTEAEEIFYNRYELFDDNLKNQQLKDENNARMIEYIIETKQSSKLNDYKITKIGFNNGKITYTLNVFFVITEENPEKIYDGSFRLQFVLALTGIFQYRISNIINITQS